MILEASFIKKFGIYIITFLVCYQFSAQDLSLPESLKGKISFNFAELEQTPSYRWGNQKDSVWSLYYKGNEFKGSPTEVFAYYASPSTLSSKKTSKEKYPAIVVVHGGGGTAFKIWVREWAKKGYAAIAMDLGGAKPLPENEQETPWSTKSTPLLNGAPDDTDAFKFFNIDKDFSMQWQFHAVSNIIRAHSLIQSFSDTDTAKTAITGISWGGYLTNIVAGIDHRFKVAVPVYGCGFLFEKSAWFKRFDSLGLSNSKKWKKLWDPSSYVGNAKTPMLFINGTNDFAYPVESWQKTTELSSKAKQLLIYEMAHNHEKGSEPFEIEAFINNVFNSANNNQKLGMPIKIGKWFEIEVKCVEEIREAQFIFTKSADPNKTRKWEIIPANIKSDTIIAEGDHNIRAAYFLIIDNNGNRLSSPVFFN